MALHMLVPSISRQNVSSTTSMDSNSLLMMTSFCQWLPKCGEGNLSWWSSRTMMKAEILLSYLMIFSSGDYDESCRKKRWEEGRSEWNESILFSYCIKSDPSGHQQNEKTEFLFSIWRWKEWREIRRRGRMRWLIVFISWWGMWFWWYPKDPFLHDCRWWWWFCC